MMRALRSRQAPARQRGVALVVALSIVAIVVMLGVALSGDFLLLFRRIENQLYSEQAYAYLLGAESLARAALLQDLQTDDQQNPKDDLAEPWAQEQQFPTDHGWIGGRIEDAQGRFNLNSLAGTQAGGGQPGSSDYTSAQEHFIRLLVSLPLEEQMPLDQAQALTESIADWIDQDDDVTNLGGAESQYYADADPPGKPANRTLVSPSELMWVKGMTPEIYRALAPLVTVWPNTSAQGGVGAVNGFNINTAPPALLACLGVAKSFEPLSESELKSVLKYREEHESINPQELGTLLPGKQIDSSLVVTVSEYFLVNSETEFLGHRYSLHSLLYRNRDKGAVVVQGRTFGEW